MCYHVQYFAAAGREKNDGVFHDENTEEIYCVTELQEVVGCRTSKSKKE